MRRHVVQDLDLEIQSFEPTLKNILVVGIFANSFVGCLNTVGQPSSAPCLPPPAGETYNEQLDKRLAERCNHMVDFDVELVRSCEGSPASEDGMCDFEDANVDLGVCRGESADELLGSPKSVALNQATHGAAYLGEGIPAPPEVRVRDDADGFSELTLDIGGAGDHEANEAFFDQLHLVLGQLIVAFLVLESKSLASTATARRGSGSEAHAPHSWIE